MANETKNIFFFVFLKQPDRSRQERHNLQINEVFKEGYP